VSTRTSGLVQKLALLVVLAATVAMLTASTTLGALVNGALPAAGFTYTSVTDNSVSIAGGGVTPASLATLEKYVANLSAISNPTAAQQAALATYQARLATYQARYAAAIDLRASSAANVKTTYSRQAPDPAFAAGWHYHNGPVIVTVTVGTLTFYDKTCGSWDLTAGHTYIETPGQVLNAKVLPAKNAGIATVEWFTTRLYGATAADPAPVDPPCAL
jgi:hypothetical protein